MLIGRYNLEVGFALQTQQVHPEPLTFTGNGSYALRNTPISTLGPQINGIVEITQNITHGAFEGASDQLPNTPVVSVSLITQGGVNFVQGTDYAQVGNKVASLGGGSQPSPGSTYTITYRYSAIIQPDDQRRPQHHLPRSHGSRAQHRLLRRLQASTSPATT